MGVNRNKRWDREGLEGIYALQDAGTGGKIAEKEKWAGAWIETMA